MYKFLAVNLEGKRPLRKSKHGWEDYIKMSYKVLIWWKGVDWIHMAQDRNQQQPPFHLRL
jgi:hypothetical protein